MPTHFTAGVSDVTPGNPLYDMGRLDPTKYYIFWNDFSDPLLSTEWGITLVGTSTITFPDAGDGIARVTTDTAENEGVWMETLNETFLLASGRKTWLKARLSVGDAIQSDWVVGLHSTSATPQAATVRFLFESVDGSATVHFNNDNNTDDTDSATLVTMTDDNFVTLAAYYNGVDEIRLYVDEAAVDIMTGITVPAAEMGVGFGYINGTSGVETSDFDYVLVVQER